MAIILIVSSKNIIPVIKNYIYAFHALRRRRFQNDTSSPAGTKMVFYLASFSTAFSN